MTDSAQRRWWLRPWWVWIMPLASLGFAGYLMVSFIDWRHFKATIAFEEVDGIEAGKTKIKYRGLVVGEVAGVHLSTQSLVLVDAHIEDAMKPLLKEGGTFWLIEPNFAMGEIQGMGTLFAGPYLDLQPGRGKKEGYFLGIARPRQAGERFSGLTFKLRTSVNQSLSVGNPILYRGVKVGAVTKIRLSADARAVEIEAKINQDYDQLVRANSVFWKESGIQADIGLLGAKINIPTFESLISGAVAFATPDPPGPAVDAGHVFDLQPAAKKEWLAWAPAIKS